MISRIKDQDWCGDCSSGETLKEFFAQEMDLLAEYVWKYCGPGSEILAVADSFSEGLRLPLSFISSICWLLCLSFGFHLQVILFWSLRVWAIVAIHCFSRKASSFTPWKEPPLFIDLLFSARKAGYPQELFGFCSRFVSFTPSPSKNASDKPPKIKPRSPLLLCSPTRQCCLYNLIAAGEPL